MRHSFEWHPDLKISIFVFYLSGKPRAPHLLRCQGIAVKRYSFNLDRLEATALSTFGILVHMENIFP